VVKQAAGLPSALEIHSKVTSKKGEARNLGHNEYKERPPAPPPKPKKPSKTKKHKKPKEPVQIENKETSEALTTKVVNPQQVVIACVALAVTVLGYVFLV